MSNHTKAWVLAREVPDDELRTELILANERILDAAEDLADEDDEPGDLEAGVYNAITWRDNVRGIADKLDCGTDEIEDAIGALQERPEPESKDGQVISTETPEVRALKDRVAHLERMLNETIDESHALRVELDAEKTRKVELPATLQTAVGDVLAMSRKLTTFCEAAGIKPATLRVHERKRHEAR